MIAPHFKSLAESNKDKITFVKIDVDENGDTATEVRDWHWLRWPSQAICRASMRVSAPGRSCTRKQVTCCSFATNTKRRQCRHCSKGSVPSLHSWRSAAARKRRNLAVLTLIRSRILLTLSNNSAALNLSMRQVPRCLAVNCVARKFGPNLLACAHNDADGSVDRDWHLQRKSPMRSLEAPIGEGCGHTSNACSVCYLRFKNVLRLASPLLQK